MIFLLVGMVFLFVGGMSGVVASGCSGGSGGSGGVGAIVVGVVGAIVVGVVGAAALLLASVLVSSFFIT